MAASRVAARSDVFTAPAASAEHHRRWFAMPQCLDSRTNDFYMLQVAICWNVRLLEAADEIVAEKFDLLTRFMPVRYCESGKATIKCHR